MNRYLIGFWNVENLFAPEGFAEREPWLARKVRRELRGWSEDNFKRKVSQISTGIAAMSGSSASTQGPDLLGVCEVENKYVLDALTRSLNERLPDRDYGIVHADSTRDKRGIDTAFIFDQSRLSVDPACVFSHFVIRRTGTRDITQATFMTDSGDELVALANHWPARSGGAEKSAGFRATAGETLSYWHERIREERGSDMPVIALGDLNDDPWDPSVRFNANATREEGDVGRARSARFYNLAWRYLHQQVVDHRGDEREIDGTLYYENDGNVFDQILVNPSLLTGDRKLRVLPETTRIAAMPAMVDHRAGRGPIRFGLPDGNASKNINHDGFSDHFPVAVELEEML